MPCAFMRLVAERKLAAVTAVAEARPWQEPVAA